MNYFSEITKFFVSHTCYLCCMNMYSKYTIIFIASKKNEGPGSSNRMYEIQVFWLGNCDLSNSAKAPSIILCISSVYWVRMFKFQTFTSGDYLEVTNIADIHKK